MILYTMFLKNSSFRLISYSVNGLSKEVSRHSCSDGNLSSGSHTIVYKQGSSEITVGKFKLRWINKWKVITQLLDMSTRLFEALDKKYSNWNRPKLYMCTYFLFLGDGANNIFTRLFFSLKKWLTACYWVTNVVPVVLALMKSKMLQEPL